MFRLMIACLALAAASFPQGNPCWSVNDVNNNVTGALTSSTAGSPNVFAFQVALPRQVYQSLEIFTGNTAYAPGFMTLELARNDPATNLPATVGVRYGGTWQISPALGDAWQGTNMRLDLVPFTQGDLFWIVWSEPGSSAEPYEPGGITMPMARLVGTTWTLQPTPVALKCRLFCRRLDGAQVTVFGSPCPTVPGYWGTLFTNQQPAVGNASFALEGTGFPPGQTAMLVLGTNPNFGSRSVPGLPANCMQHTDDQVVLFGGTGTGDVLAHAGVPGAFGHVSFALPIPADAALVGLFVASQLAVLDPAYGVPLPFTTTNALHMVVF